MENGTYGKKLIIKLPILTHVTWLWVSRQIQQKLEKCPHEVALNDKITKFFIWNSCLWSNFGPMYGIIPKNLKIIFLFFRINILFFVSWIDRLEWNMCVWMWKKRTKLFFHHYTSTVFITFVLVSFFLKIFDRLSFIMTVIKFWLVLQIVHFGIIESHYL